MLCISGIHLLIILYNWTFWIFFSCPYSLGWHHINLKQNRTVLAIQAFMCVSAISKFQFPAELLLWTRKRENGSSKFYSQEITCSPLKHWEQWIYDYLSKFYASECNFPFLTGKDNGVGSNNTLIEIALHNVNSVDQE